MELSVFITHTEFFPRQVDTANISIASAAAGAVSAGSSSMLNTKCLVSPNTLQGPGRPVYIHFASSSCEKLWQEAKNFCMFFFSSPNIFVEGCQRRSVLLTNVARMLCSQGNRFK